MIMLLPTATGFFESSLMYPRAHDLFYSDSYLPASYYSLGGFPSCADRQPVRAPQWTATSDAFNLKMLVPEMQPDSLTADLIQDESGGLAVKVTGTRKIEGCSCEPTAVREVPLPYRPRPEDVTVHTDGSTMVTVKLARGHAQSDQPKVPLTIIKDKQVKAPPAGTELSVAQEAQKSVEAQERSLTDKFRAVAHAATAVAAPKAEIASDAPAA